MKLKKESLFLKSFNLLKSNPNKAGLMVLFDALFLVSAFVLKTLFGYFSQSIVVEKTLTFGIIFLVLSLVYYLIVLFVYSFFKYNILDFIKSLFEMSEIARSSSKGLTKSNKAISEHTQKSSIFDETEFSFKKLGQFYSLNIIIAGIFFVVMLVLNFILASIKQGYQPFVFIVLAVPYLLFLYAIINTSHSLFYEGNSIKDSIKNGFKITFTKIKVYRETILIMVLSALVLWLLFLGSGYLIRLIASKNYTLYLTIYAYFKNISVIVFDIIFYLVILINRISFYAIIRENK